MDRPHVSGREAKVLREMRPRMLMTVIRLAPPERVIARLLAVLSPQNPSIPWPRWESIRQLGSPQLESRADAAKLPTACLVAFGDS